MLAKPVLCVAAAAVVVIADQPDEGVVTWTKPGLRYRAREVTLQPSTVTVTEISTIIPTATIRLRSLPPPMKRTVKRAFLSSWSFQGCVADGDNLPPMVSPFPYQLATEDVSGASCSDFCDRLGDSFAATQNGNECWCGDESKAVNVTLIHLSQCNMPCAGQRGEKCGGKNSLSIYSKAA